MSYIVAMVSGKGGAGKTTLALGMSLFLEKQGVKTLLVDCDQTTHGASIAFGNYLREAEHVSIEKIMRKEMTEADTDSEICQIKPNLSFIHSSVSASGDSKMDHSAFCDYIKTISPDYKVVILDCQAGDGPLTHSVLEISTINLMVREPDKASDAAITNMHVRIGSKLQKNKTYQVFNKTNEEEYQRYSGLQVGTLFPPLEPVRLNEKIRQAINQERTPYDPEDPVYNLQLMRICRKIFPEIDKLEDTYLLELQVENAKKLELNEFRKKEIRERRRTMLFSLFSTLALLPVVTFGALLVFQMQNLKMLENKEIVSEAHLLLIFIVIAALFCLISHWNTLNNSFRRSAKLQKEIGKQDRIIRRIKGKIEEQGKKNDSKAKYK